MVSGDDTPGLSMVIDYLAKSPDASSAPFQQAISALLVLDSYEGDAKHMMVVMRDGGGITEIIAKQINPEGDGK